MEFILSSWGAFDRIKFLEHFPWLQNTAHIGSLGKGFAKPDARRPLRGMLVNPGERG